MSGNLRLYGATSGYSQISAPDVAGDQIFVVPSLGGEVIVSGNNQSLDLGTGDLTVDSITANSLTLPTAPVVGYQQGNWIPEVAGSSTAGTYTYTNNIGQWSRMGNTVFIQATITNINTVSAGSGTLLIINFPYMPSSDNNSTGNVRFDQVDLPTDTVYVVPTTSDNNRCGFQSVKDNANDVSLSLSSSTFTSSLADIFMSMTYITDDTTWTPIAGATVS